MRYEKTFAFLSIAGVLLLTGCAATSTITEDFYKPTESFVAKQDATLGLIKDPSFKNEEIVIPGGFSCTLSIKPLGGLIQKELQTIYRDVKLLQTLDEGNDCDAYAVYKLQLRAMPPSTYYQANLSIDFFSSDKVTLITHIDIPYEGYHDAPVGLAAVSGALTGATFGLLAPVTLPATAQASCDSIRKTAETTISVILPEMNSKIRNNMLLSASSLKLSGDSQTGSSVANSRYERYLKSTVVVLTDRGQGSGFFVRDGVILTNHHVVDGVGKVDVCLLNGKRIRGKVIASDSVRDLAAIEIPPNDYPILRFDYEPVQGDSLILVGAPKGFNWSVTKGILSAIRTDGTVRYIQTDAASSPGNSGGPLISLETGKVVGVISFARKNAENLNFAISATDAKKFIRRLD